MLKKITQKNYSTIITTFCITIISYYIFAIYLQNPKQEIPSKSVINNEYTNGMKNIIIKEFTDNGKLSRITYAENMLHFDKKNFVTVQKPIIHVLDQAEEPYIITAESAETSSKFAEITLIGKVNIVQNAKNEYTQINTDSIIFYPNKNFAETSEEITILYNHNLTLKSKGMTVDFNKKIFIMNNNARGTYAS